MITVFKSITDTKTPHYVSPEAIYKRIKNGEDRDKIEAIRSEKNKDKRGKMKGQLPSICWSGEFTSRSNSAITKHSGLVCVDFDHLDDVSLFKEKLKDDKFVHIAFVSPSGDGLKVIIKIPPSIETHADSCRAITEHFNNEKLDEFRDIARVCYSSHDEDIYFHPDSQIFTGLVKEKPKSLPAFYGVERIDDTRDIFDRLVVWADKRNAYIDGNKHNYLVAFIGACIRFGISEYDSSSLAYSEFSGRAGSVKRDDFDNLAATMYKNYSFMADTAYFEKAGKAMYLESKEEVKDEVFNTKLHQKDIIYIDNVKKSMREGFKSGKAKGTTTYYKEFDDRWTWRRKEVTFVGGIGNMGKTIMINNLSMLKAINEGWKFAIFSPEQDPPDDFYNDLIHTYVGKSTEPHHHNQMTPEEYEDAMNFVGRHFFYIFPETESPTPEYINSCFEFAVKKHKVDVVIIDPFNQLDNDWKKHGRDDLYISEFLGGCKRFSQRHNVAYMIAGHPKGNLQKNGGNYEQPNVYDYAGGAMWNNKCDNILCYHRPYAITDPSSTECFFISQKIKKRKLTGTPGSCQMVFNVSTNRFEDQFGNSPFDKPTTPDPNQFIEPNIGFNR